MVRPCKCRFVSEEPPVAGFKPAGVSCRRLEAVELGLDEVEALRLADLLGLYHEQAAERMGVSRPTFGRIIARAREKVASALFQSRMLVFKGGPIMMANKRTFECAECGAQFQAPHGAGRPQECPQCHSTNFHRATEDRGGGRHRGRCGGGGGGGGGRGQCRRRGGRQGSSTAASQKNSTADKEPPS